MYKDSIKGTKYDSFLILITRIKDNEKIAQTRVDQFALYQ